MDVRENGDWKFSMHAPDGTNFPNRSIFLKVIENQTIRFEHFNPHFITTVIFESQESGTILHWTMKFDSPDLLATIVQAHKADQGLEQNLNKLERYLNEV